MSFIAGIFLRQPRSFRRISSLTTIHSSPVAGRVMLLCRRAPTIDRAIKERRRLAGRLEFRELAISPVLTVAGVAGLALVGLLIVRSGAGEVAHAMLTLGWRLAPITVFHLIPLSSARSRGANCCRRRPGSISPAPLGSAGCGNPSITCCRSRASAAMLRACGSLTCVASARAQAGASVVVDTTVGVVTQLVFVSAGVTL